MTYPFHAARYRLRWSSLLAALIVALPLGGCVDKLSNRPLVEKKGVYAGAPDQPLSKSDLEALRQRALKQRGAVGL